jgi:hypothetical protein
MLTLIASQKRMVNGPRYDGANPAVQKKDSLQKGPRVE